MCKKPLKMVNDRGNGSWFNHVTFLLQIQTKFMTRNKIFFYRFIYFSKSFISTVKAGRKLASRPDILITKGTTSFVNATLLVANSSPGLP